MVQIIAGKKGKGKTKHLLDMANAAIKGANGTVVYLDKSAQHMYELNNKIRLINVNEFQMCIRDRCRDMTARSSWRQALLYRVLPLNCLRMAR